MERRRQAQGQSQKVGNGIVNEQFESSGATRTGRTGKSTALHRCNEVARDLSGQWNADPDPSAFWGVATIRNGPCLPLGREAVSFHVRAWLSDVRLHTRISSSEHSHEMPHVSESLSRPLN